MNNKNNARKREVCRPPSGPDAGEVAVNAVLLHPNQADHIIVCNRSSSVYTATFVGQVVKSWSSGRRIGGNFVAAAVSPRATFLYCLGEDGNLYCFNMKEGRLDHLLAAHSGSGAPIGVVQHPLRNLVATYADEADFKLWKAG